MEGYLQRLHHGVAAGACCHASRRRDVIEDTWLGNQAHLLCGFWKASRERFRH